VDVSPQPLVFQSPLNTYDDTSPCPMGTQSVSILLADGRASPMARSGPIGVDDLCISKMQPPEKERMVQISANGSSSKEPHLSLVGDGRNIGEEEVVLGQVGHSSLDKMAQLTASDPWPHTYVDAVCSGKLYNPRNSWDGSLEDQRLPDGGQFAQELDEVKEEEVKLGEVEETPFEKLARLTRLPS